MNAAGLVDINQKIIDNTASVMGLPANLKTVRDVFRVIERQQGTAVGTEVLVAARHAFQCSTPPVQLDALSRLIDAQSVKKISQFAEKYLWIKNNMTFLVQTTPDGLIKDSDCIPIRAELAKLPFITIKKAVELKQYLIVTNDNVTNSQACRYLKTRQPRGYPLDKTWDDVPGAGAGGQSDTRYQNATVIAMTESVPGSGIWKISSSHGSVSLVLHEFSHAIDRSFGELGGMGRSGTPGMVGDYFSHRTAFRAAWQKDLSAAVPGSHDYYLWQNGTDGGAEEAFAEIVAEIYSQKNQHKWPAIKRYLESIVVPAAFFVSPTFISRAEAALLAVAERYRNFQNAVSCHKITALLALRQALGRALSEQKDPSSIKNDLHNMQEQIDNTLFLSIPKNVIETLNCLAQNNALLSTVLDKLSAFLFTLEENRTAALLTMKRQLTDALLLLPSAMGKVPNVSRTTLSQLQGYIDNIIATSAE